MLHAAVAMALEVARRQGAVSGLQAWQSLIWELDELRQGGDSLEDAVSVLTVHRAKGLEFDHVFLAGLQGDTFPNLKFTEHDPVAMEAERRLFYVGITRARHALVLSSHGMSPSPDEETPKQEGFIGEIPTHLVEVIDVTA